jgi:sulfur dioxygenase
LISFLFLFSYFKLGFTSSSIGEEKKLNPRLIQTKSKFIETMKTLNLPYPRLIDRAVPANLVCGVLEDIQK